MPALDLRRTSLSTVTSDLHLHRHQTLRKRLCPSPLTSPLSGLQRSSIPSLLASFLSLLAPPTTRTRALQWRRQQFASITCATEERVCHVPLLVSGKGRPAVGTGRGCSPRNVSKSILVPGSRQPVDRWDVQACYIVECERNSAGKRPHSDILDVSCHTNSEFTPHGALKKKKQSQIQCKEQ